MKHSDGPLLVPNSSVVDTGAVLLIDAANVIGSRPTGWWNDRPAAAREFVSRVRSATRGGELSDSIVVLEGAARRGVEEGVADCVTVLYAPADGDAMLVRCTERAGGRVVLVSADRALRRSVEALGGRCVGPRWLLDRLGT
jgi:hypothetical protein